MFQHDNDPKHNFKSTRHRLQQNKEGSGRWNQCVSSNVQSMQDRPGISKRLKAFLQVLLQPHPQLPQNTALRLKGQHKALRTGIKITLLTRMSLARKCKLQCMLCHTVCADSEDCELSYFMWVRPINYRQILIVFTATPPCTSFPSL